MDATQMLRPATFLDRSPTYVKEISQGSRTRLKCVYQAMNDVLGWETPFRWEKLPIRFVPKVISQMSEAYDWTGNETNIRPLVRAVCTVDAYLRGGEDVKERLRSGATELERQLLGALLADGIGSWTDLEPSVSKVSDELIDCTKILHTFVTKLSNATQRMKVEHAGRTKLEREYSALVKRNREQGSEIQEKDGTIAMVRKQLSEARTTIQYLTEKNAQLRVLGVEEQNQRIVALEKERSSFLDQVAAHAKTVDALTQANETMEDLRVLLQDADAENDRLERYVEELIGELGALYGRIAAEDSLVPATADRITASAARSHAEVKKEAERELHVRAPSGRNIHYSGRFRRTLAKLDSPQRALVYAAMSVFAEDQFDARINAGLVVDMNKGGRSQRPIPKRYHCYIPSLSEFRVSWEYGDGSIEVLDLYRKNQRGEGTSILMR